MNLKSPKNILFWSVHDELAAQEPARVMEYQGDIVLHGLTLLQAEGAIGVLDSNRTHWHMHAESIGGKKGDLYGRGFSIAASLPGAPPEKKTAFEKGLYDAAIVTIHTTRATTDNHCGDTKCVVETLDYLLSGLRIPKVALIDTLDQSHLLFEEALGREGVLYYKRELADAAPEEIRPIQYGIPEALIVGGIPKKEKEFALIKPGGPYLYTNEDEYHREYQRSRYGEVTRRGGWGTMRVLEVLANGCCPYFEGLEECPKRTLTHLPKELILEGMGIRRGEGERSYNEVMAELLAHTRAHLTTRAVAARLLEELLS